MVMSAASSLILRRKILTKFIWVSCVLCLLSLGSQAKVAPTQDQNTVLVKSKDGTVRHKSNTLRRAANHVVVPSRPSFGQLAGLHQHADDLALKSSVAYVIDQDTHEVLLSKNDQAVLPIASITKLMTGLIVSENKLDLSQPITITEDDVDTEKAAHRDFAWAQHSPVVRCFIWR